MGCGLQYWSALSGRTCSGSATRSSRCRTVRNPFTSPSSGGTRSTWRTNGGLESRMCGRGRSSRARLVNVCGFAAFDPIVTSRRTRRDRQRHGRADSGRGCGDLRSKAGGLRPISDAGMTAIVRLAEDAPRTVRPFRRPAHPEAFKAARRYLDSSGSRITASLIGHARGDRRPRGATSTRHRPRVDVRRWRCLPPSICTVRSARE